MGMQTTQLAWRGPSRWDGSAMRAIASCLVTRSTNRKTGNMVQFTVQRDDMPTSDAAKQWLDGAMCGPCIYRGDDLSSCIRPWIYTRVPTGLAYSRRSDMSLDRQRCFLRTQQASEYVGLSVSTLAQDAFEGRWSRVLKGRTTDRGLPPG